MRLIIFCTLLFTSQITFSQVFEIRNYTTKSGLNQSVVTFATQDLYHQMWFATYDGLSVFDGQNFSNISVLNGLPVPIANRVQLFNGKIYACLRGALVEIEPNTKAVTVLSQFKGDSDVREMTAANGIIYFVSDTSLYQFQSGKESHVNDFIFSKSILISQIIVLDNQYYMITDKNILVYKNEKNFPLKPTHVLDIQNVQSIFNFNHKKYVLANNFIYELTDKGLAKPHPLDTSIPTLKGVVLFNQTILLGYGNSGLFFLDTTFTTKNHFHRNNGLTTNLIMNVFVDVSNNIWVLTEGAGIILIRSIDILNFNAGSHFPINFTYLLVRHSSKEFLLGSVGDGLNLVDTEGNIIKRWLSNQTVMSGVLDSNDRFWFDVQNVGFYYMDHLGTPIRFETPKLVGGNVRVLKQDQKNRIWLGTNRGIYRIDRNKLEKIYEGNDDSQTLFFNDLAVINDSTAMVVSEVNGLYLLTHHSLKNIDFMNIPISKNAIKRILLDSNKRIWIASTDGVFASEDYVHFNNILNTKDFNSGAVWGLMEDRDHRIWASATKGIFVISADQSVRFLNENYGLNSSEYNRFSLMQDDAGYIWAGAVDNLVKINPMILQHTPITPSLRLQKILTNIGEVQIDTTINLTREVKWIQFEMGLSDFVARDKVMFRYRIVSRDTVWLPSIKSSKILLDNLTPGYFDIELSAIDFLGRDSNHIKISFYLPKPFWLSTWFITLLVVFLFILIYYLYQFRLHVLEEREIKLSALIAERTQELESNKKFIEQLIDSATEVIFTVNADGQIQIWNLEAQQYFGFTKEEIFEKQISIIDEMDSHPLYAIFKSVTEGKNVHREKIELKAKNEDFGLMLVSSYPMLDENGTVISVVFIMTDVKQHELLESELLEYVTGLALLKNTLSTITHYVNNSITAVLGVAEMAKTKEKYQAKLVDVAIAQSLEIRAVIKSLENINSKLDIKTTQYPDLTHHIFDIQSEIDAHLKSYKDLISKENINDKSSKS